jgi:hypothetical protein
VAACPDEAERNFAWMARAGAGAQHDGDVQIMVGVEGERDLTEHELEHLRGYRGSRPVRVGNAAWSQTQLDMYGGVLASAQVLGDQIGGMGDAVRDFLCTLADGRARARAGGGAGAGLVRGGGRPAGLRGGLRAPTTSACCRRRSTRPTGGCSATSPRASRTWG